MSASKPSHILIAQMNNTEVIVITEDEGRATITLTQPPEHGVYTEQRDKHLCLRVEVVPKCGCCW